MDYSDKETCCWEPQGNGHYLTRCGELIFDRKFSPTKDRVCRECGKPFDEGTYINKREEVPETPDNSLPTDEEIEKWVNGHGYYGYCTAEYYEGLEEGAKWVRNMIKR